MSRNDDRSILGWAAIIAQMRRGPGETFEWTESFSDKLALNHFPEPLVRRLRRFCEANPVGAEDLVAFVTEVFDAGRERGNQEGRDEVAAETRRKLQEVLDDHRYRRPGGR